MDRDVLFGVIAVQLGQATPTQVMADTSAYVTDPSKGIAERLRAEGGAHRGALRDALRDGGRGHPGARAWIDRLVVPVPSLGA